MNVGGTIRLNKVGLCFICLFIVVFLFYLSPRMKGGSGPTNGVEMVNLRQLLIAGIEAAERGGLEVARARGLADKGEKSKGKTKEGANIPVTKADLSSHCVMYSGLTSIYPSIMVISEEKDTKCEPQQLMELKEVPGVEDLPDEKVDPSKLLVWIDPLDATQEYTENILECVTTMVCVVLDGNPIMGVIHKPFGKEPRTSWTWLNKGKAPHLNIVANENSTKTVIVSRSHPGEVEKKLKEALGPDINIIHAGGAGYKVLEVIKGNAKAYVHTTAIKKWDICAGDAIVTALGGRMSTLDDQDIDYSSLSEENNRGLLVTTSQHKDYAAKLKNVLG